MKVVIVSGIWPPDVGGPASHAPELADFLHGRGHEVRVVTTADAPPAPQPYPVDWTPRRYPPGVRHFLGAGLVHRAAAGADVVYSTGMLGRSSLGSRIAGVPLVQRLAGDPAYERALRRGLTSAPLDRFQEETGAQISVLRRARDRALRRAARIVVPSRAFAEIVAGWGFEAEVVPHAVSAPSLPDVAPNGRTLVFAGSPGSAEGALGRVRGRTPQRGRHAPRRGRRARAGEDRGAGAAQTCASSARSRASRSSS